MWQVWDEHDHGRVDDSSHHEGQWLDHGGVVRSVELESLEDGGVAWAQLNQIFQLQSQLDFLVDPGERGLLDLFVDVSSVHISDHSSVRSEVPLRGQDLFTAFKHLKLLVGVDSLAELLVQRNVRLEHGLSVGIAGVGDGSSIFSGLFLAQADSLVFGGEGCTEDVFV